MPDKIEPTEPTEPAAEIAADTTQADATTPEALTKELEAARAALKKANREAAERRKLLETYEQKEKERKEAELTEVQKLQAKLDAAERARTEMEKRLAFTAKTTAFFQAAAKAKVDWASEQARQDVVALINFSEMEETEMDAMIVTLKEQRPYLFAGKQAQQQLGETDSGAHGKAKKGDAAEKEIQDAAKSFGIKYVPPDAN